MSSPINFNILFDNATSPLAEGEISVRSKGGMLHVEDRSPASNRSIRISRSASMPLSDISHNSDDESPVSGCSSNRSANIIPFGEIFEIPDKPKEVLHRTTPSGHLALFAARPNLSIFPSPEKSIWHDPRLSDDEKVVQFNVPEGESVDLRLSRPSSELFSDRVQSVDLRLSRPSSELFSSRDSRYMRSMQSSIPEIQEDPVAEAKAEQDWLQPPQTQTSSSNPSTMGSMGSYLSLVNGIELLPRQVPPVQSPRSPRMELDSLLPKITYYPTAPSPPNVPYPSEMMQRREYLQQAHRQAAPSKEIRRQATKAQVEQQEAQAKEVSLQQHLDKTDVPESEWTTLIVRNIPCKYKQSELRREIETLQIPFNFFYLPPARTSPGNLGYFFINLYSRQEAEEFMRVYSEHKFEGASKKEVKIEFAKLQGLKANVEFYTECQTKKTRTRPFIRLPKKKLDREQMGFSGKLVRKPNRQADGQRIKEFKQERFFLPQQQQKLPVFGHQPLQPVYLAQVLRQC